jgi:glycosyltransferase involved in cell wall biosynthesis
MTRRTRQTDDLSSDKGPVEKITVAHIMPWSGIGGVEIATLRMAALTNQRFRNIAFCLPDAHELRSRFEEAGVETATYQAPEPSLRHSGKYYKDSLLIAHALKQVKADIVHFAEEKAAYHCSLAARLAGVRLVCHLRVSNPKLSLRQHLCLRPVHSFIFVSQEARQTFAIGLPETKTRVIYDAVEVPDADTTEHNLSVRREFGIPIESPIVGMVARVSPQKDYGTLADAAAIILKKHPDTRFFIVGDNSLVDLNRQHYEEVSKNLSVLGIRENFLFTGHREDVPRLISAMDICVLSTHKEGFPLSILEMMAMRKPVVATSVGGIPEIVRPGVNGYLHQHGNSKELADAIVTLIEDPDKIKKMGLAACEEVKKNYARDTYIENISRAYSDVMNT